MNFSFFRKSNKTKALVDPPVMVKKDLGSLVENQVTNERGSRSTPENQIRYLYQQMWVDTERRATVLDLRYMDRVDGRVKKIHTRMARTAVKSGLYLDIPPENDKIMRRWKLFTQRTRINHQQKLESDARGMAIEGNLALQWVLNASNEVCGCIRMPSETLNPRVNGNGTFVDARTAYEQMDLLQGRVVAVFPLWSLTIGRLNPDNFDDWGSMGRGYLDGSRGVWKKLDMTDRDLVVRRHTRAAQKNAHILKNASQEFYETYTSKIETDIDDVKTDFVIRGDGDVKPIQGDANLDQIADVSYLLDTFFAGSPAPKGLFGYVGDLNRDILEELRRDFFDEVDALQDIQAWVYEQGFRLDLLLAGINPDDYEFTVKFAERKTETPNQRADLALKYQALGLSGETVMRAAGVEPAEEQKRLYAQRKNNDPYPDPQAIGQTKPGPRVTVTQNNAKKGESSTSISNS